MYLEEFCDIKTYRSGKPQFKNSFRYWRNRLFEQVNKLFTWEGLPFKQKEIETRLILHGYCGIIKDGEELIATQINMNGVTNYYDEFVEMDFTTPLIHGKRTIDEDSVVVDNNTLRNPTISIIDRYAMLLAHTEISLVTAMVNGRATRTAIAQNEKVATAFRNYSNKLYNGCNDVIVDKMFGESIEIRENDSTSLNSVKTLYDIRQNLLYSFLEDMGIKKNQMKKERMNTDEVQADDTLLKLNIKDMFDARKKACEDVNRIFGVNWSVKCNVDFDADGVVEFEKEGESNEVERTISEQSNVEKD